MHAIKKAVAVSIASLIFLLSPGLGSYRAFAGAAGSGAAPSAAEFGNSAFRVGAVPPGMWLIQPVTGGVGISLSPLLTGGKGAEPILFPAGTTRPANLEMLPRPSLDAGRSAASLGGSVSSPHGAVTLLGDPVGGSVLNAAESLAGADPHAKQDESRMGKAPTSGAFFDVSRRHYRNPEELKGKTIVVAGAEPLARKWMGKEILRVAQILRLHPVIVDRKEWRPEELPQDDFVEADTIDHSAENIQNIAEKIEKAVEGRSLEVVGATTFFNSFVELMAKVRDVLRPHFPTLLGDSYDSVFIANHKHLARKILARYAPDLSVPSEEIHGAQEARDAFVRLTKDFPPHRRKVVVKLTHSAGKLGTRADISSPEQAAQVYEEVHRSLEKFLEENKTLGGLHGVDQKPGIIMEFQLEGPEVDIEFIVDVLKAVATVVGNPKPVPIYRQEKGFTIPSQLSKEVQARGILAGLRALHVLRLFAGNYHMEMKYDPDLGWRVIEYNTRMGGGELFLMMRRLFSISLIEQGIRAMLGLWVVPPTRQEYPVLVSRYLLPRYSGKILKIEGMDDLKRSPGVLTDMVLERKKPGHPDPKYGRVIAPQDGYGDDDFGYLVVGGTDHLQAKRRALEALSKVTITILQDDGTIVTQRGDHGHDLGDEEESDPPLSTRGPQAPLRLEGTLLLEGPSSGVWSKLKNAWTQLPSTFRNYLGASSLIAAAGEGTGILYLAYGIGQFGWLIGLMAQLVGLAARIPGSLYAAKKIEKYDALKIYKITTLAQGAMLGILFLGATFLEGMSTPYLNLFLLNQLVGGLIYGATRGMAENKIMPELVGQNRKRLEIAGFIWMGAVETAALGTAFLISPFLRSTLGISVTFLIYAGVLFSSLYFLKRARDAKSQKSLQEDAESASDEEEGTQDKLPIREYIPYVLSSFLHFSFYAFFTGVFAEYTFHRSHFTDYQFGLYDTGSLVISILVAIPALLASLGQARPKAAVGKRGLLDTDRLSLKGWFGMAAAVAVAYLASGKSGLAPAGLALAAILGAVVTVNRIKWMSSYNHRLKPEHHAGMSATLSSLGTALAIVPFIAIGAGGILGLPILSLLPGIVVGVSAALLLGLALTRQPR